MRKVYEWLKISLWLLPSIVVLLSIGLALALLEVDANFNHQDWLEHWSWLFGSGAQGARQMLAVIASSVITVTGVVFSITVVVLSLASSQYSPSVLRNFISDRPSQIVLGGFLGIYVYCLVILRTVRGSDHDVFVPSISILGSLVLALGGIGLLIYFIHHISSSIRSTSIIGSVYRETLATIDAIYPKEQKDEPKRKLPVKKAQRKDQKDLIPVYSQSSGYIRSIQAGQLLRLSCQLSTEIWIDKEVGEYVGERGVLAFVPTPLSESHAQALNQCFDMGIERTFEQDVGYGIRQLVDVALKGLSPGINDTTTALICIDHLGSILSYLADRKVRDSDLYESDQLRVCFKSPTFGSFVSQCFDQIRRNAMNNPEALTRILISLEAISYHISDPSRIQSLRNQASLVRDVIVKQSPAGEYTEAFQALFKVEQRLIAQLSSSNLGFQNENNII